MAAANGNGGTRAAGPRCIALVGPFQSGKTTLLEAMLARTGAIQRQGTVDAGSSVGDASKEARHHKMGVGLTAATTSFSLSTASDTGSGSGPLLPMQVVQPNPTRCKFSFSRYGSRPASR